MKSKLIRLTTIDASLDSLLKGQLRYLNSDFEVVGVADNSGLLAGVGKREGIRTIAVPIRREISLKNDLHSLLALYRLFRREQPHIVHANTPKASLLGMVAACLARVPHRIYTVTGLRFETTHGLFRLVLKTMERITCLCATKIIPEGDGVRDTLNREHITRKPMQKILNGNINGVDVEYFSRTRDVMMQAVTIKGDSKDFIFTFIGRIVRDKGVNELISAFDRLTQKLNGIRLFLIGDFEDELDPVSFETKCIIETNEHIHFAGYQNDIRPFLAASDALVLPSYREGFPNVVLQAGAMGLPCIVTNINGCNEIILEGRNGTIIPKQNTEALYNTMKQWVEHPDLVKTLADDARRLIIERYRQQDVWAATLEMYKSLD